MTGVFTLDMLSEKEHYCGPDGARYDGASTIVKVLDKPALVGAANRLGLKGLRIEDEWYTAAANRGKVAHGRIEAWARDLAFDSSNIDPNLMDESDASLERFKVFWDEHGFEFIDAERLMVVPEIRAGGRLDLLLKSRKRGTRCLIDVKTSSGFFAEQKLQICGYGHMIQVPHLENPTRGKGPMFWVPADPVPIDEYWIARVGKDEPGDMDGMELSRSEVDLHTRVFLGLAGDLHYDLKKVLARR